MQICLVGKYPPIQGGVSARDFWISRWLAGQGHGIDVVSNADEVESGYRIRLLQGDAEWLAPRFERGAVRVWATEPHGPPARRSSSNAMTDWRRSKRSSPTVAECAVSSPRLAARLPRLPL
jgi:hypothetical protein